jgi:hypothetical protein
MATTTSAAGRPVRASLAHTLLVGLLAGLVASVANLIVFFVAQALGAPFLVPMGGPGAPTLPLPFAAVVATSTIPGLGAAVLYWALGRFTGGRATTIFVAVAVAFGLLSLVGPLTLPIDLFTRLSLALMHIVAGVIITGGLVRSARQG